MRGVPQWNTIASAEMSTNDVTVDRGTCDTEGGGPTLFHPPVCYEAIISYLLRHFPATVYLYIASTHGVDSQTGSA